MKKVSVIFKTIRSFHLKFCDANIYLINILLISKSIVYQMHFVKFEKETS